MRPLALLLMPPLLGGCILVSPALTPEALPRGTVEVGAGAGGVALLGAPERPGSGQLRSGPAPAAYASVRVPISAREDLGVDVWTLGGPRPNGTQVRLSLRQARGTDAARPRAWVHAASVVRMREASTPEGFPASDQSPGLSPSISTSRLWGRRAPASPLLWYGGWTATLGLGSSGAGGLAGLEWSRGSAFVRGEAGAGVSLYTGVTGHALVTAGLRF